MNLEAKEFLKDSLVQKIRETLNCRREKEIAGFKNLLDKNIISNGFYNIVKSDREYFYSGASGSVAFINFLSVSAGRNRLSKERYSALWKTVFHDNPPMDPRLLSSPWFFYYLQNYLRYEELIVDSTDIKTLSELEKKGIRHTHNLEYAKRHLSDPFMEYYYAAYIYYEAINNNFEKELIPLFNQFNKDYPHSKYQKYLAPLIEKISEFQHKEKLEKLLKSENVEMLYISIDKDENTNQWKDMIKLYNLEGYHIKANKELTNDLRRIFGQNGSISIPWYIIADGKGIITEKNADPPSQLGQLKKQINGDS